MSESIKAEFLVGKLLVGKLMKKLGFLLLLGSAVPAVAADLPASVSAPKADEAVYDWSGFYAGALVGYGVGASGAEGEASSFDGSAPDDRADVDPEGFLGGAVAGYNWQFKQFVYGLEAEVGYLGANDGFYWPDGNDYFGDVEYGAYGSLAARFGVAFDKSLFTAKAGAIVADVDYGYGDLDGSSTSFYADSSASVFGGDARLGILVGASFERVIQDGWMARVGYSYANFGSHTEFDTGGSSYKISDDLHMVHVGLTKQF